MMVRRFTVVSVLALLLCGAGPAWGDPGGLTQADVERGLALEVKRLSPEKVQPGEAIRLEIKLTNRSNERIFPVVEPGDGSEVGWREPHVRYTAWIDAGDGQWQKVPEARYGRCGLFDAQWQNDVVELLPGKNIELKQWLAAPETMLELQQAGKVRLHVHYCYRGGVVGKGDAQATSTDKGKMLGIPAFELVSKPVEFEVVRPLNVAVEVKKPLKAKTATKISEILDVQLVNGSLGGVEVKAPTLTADARLTFEIQADHGTAPTLDTQLQPYGKKTLLNPGEKAGILGDTALANGVDGTWEYPEPEKIKLRAVYTSSTWKPGAVIKSEWVELEVTE